MRPDPPDPGTTESPAKRVFVVDHHPMVREALAAQIFDDSNLELCGEAEDIESALPAIAVSKPDLVVIDITLGKGAGIDLIGQLKTVAPNVAILVWSIHTENVYVVHALQAGARGYVSKSRSAHQILDAIHTVLNGGIYLSAEIAERMRNRAPAASEEE